MQYLIGVDIGTQSTRAAVMEESGRILTQASKETELIYEGDRWVWQEPDRMYGDAVETVKAAVEKARIAPQQVASICMDAQMAGTMGIGKKGEAVTPYDSWLDKRCEDSWEELRAFGEDEIISITGAPVTYAHGPKILWWKKHRPEIYRKIDKFVPPGSYLTMRFCGLTGEQAFMRPYFIFIFRICRYQKEGLVRQAIAGAGCGRKQDAQNCPSLGSGGRLDERNRRGLRPAGRNPGSVRLRRYRRLRCGRWDHEARGYVCVAGTASVFACAVGGYQPDVKYKTILFAPGVIEGLYTPDGLYFRRRNVLKNGFRDAILRGRKKLPGTGCLGGGGAKRQRRTNFYASLFRPCLSKRRCDKRQLAGAYNAA